MYGDIIRIGSETFNAYSVEFEAQLGDKETGYQDTIQLAQSMAHPRSWAVWLPESSWNLGPKEYCISLMMEYLKTAL